MKTTLSKNTEGSATDPFAPSTPSVATGSFASSTGNHPRRWKPWPPALFLKNDYVPVPNGASHTSASSPFNIRLHLLLGSMSADISQQFSAPLRRLLLFKAQVLSLSERLLRSQIHKAKAMA